MKLHGEKNKSTISVEYFNVYFKYFMEQLKISKDVDWKETIWLKWHFRAIHQTAVENICIFFCTWNVDQDRPNIKRTQVTWSMFLTTVELNYK